MMPPSMIVIKSRELVAQFQNDGMANTTMTTTTTNTQEWMDRKLQELQRRCKLRQLPSHALQAPLRHVTVVVATNDGDGDGDGDDILETKPICRYHNYHKDGCSRYQNNNNNIPCPLDHDHCHWCLEYGHVARTCPHVVVVVAATAAATVGQEQVQGES